jgi:uncharacterized SAM-binding protein YcdF (DUF218 family)
MAALVLAGLTVVMYRRVEARAAVDRAQRADAIIVLGSAVWANERASPALAVRTQHAIQLYRAGYAPHLILTGGLGNHPPSEAEVMRRMAVSAGLPENAMVLDDRSRSTEENLANAKAIMDARGWQTAIIVSAPYHLLRAETIAQDMGMRVYGSPSRDAQTFSAPALRWWYNTRESLALVWYYSSRALGEPAWLYAWLKGVI